jgi:hypothetical protein
MKNRTLSVKARILFLITLVGVAIVTLPGAQAARIIVTSRADSGDGTLRKALAIASDSDIITFSFWVTGTITLTSGELSVNKSVTINGPGANVLAVDGRHASRVFYIAPSKTVSISGLTVRNGRAGDGAGIYNNHSTVTVNNSTISGNSTATDGSGGGIYNDGRNRGSATVTVNNSTISGNSASVGGGIDNDGTNRGGATVTVNNCTISGNSTDFHGGGGGICNESATVTVNNSTISGNSAGLGGGIDNDGSQGSATLTANNSTISGNSARFGGGIRNDGRRGSAILTGTILNAGASGGNIFNSNGGTVTSHGYNLSSDTGGGYLTGIGDRINTDPRLGRLANNGGPTFTHALLSDSPAIGAGDPNFIPPPEYDQRGPGFPRVMNGRIDIGSFEVFHAATITVINAADSGAGSLRQALASASDGDTINFSGSVTGTITLTSGELLVGKSVTISGPGAANLTVDGDGRNSRRPHRVFHISPGKTVSISGLTIANGMPVLGGINGGGIYNDHAILTVNNCTIRDNRAVLNGGGIYNDGTNRGSATVTVNNSTIRENSANSGGGIYNDGSLGSATVTVNNSTIKGNLTARIGGIYNAAISDGSAATLTISNSTISGNSAGDSGGGIYNVTSINESASATVTVSNSTINGNTGGILNRGPSSSATVINSTISENSAREFIGGGISSVDFGSLDLSGTILGFNENRNIYSSNDGTSTSHGYNLSSDDSMSGWTATGDQMNTNPLLGPLQDNGGPTFTHALVPDSPAIDAGNPTFTPPPDYDQRGPDFLRVANRRMDIGSFERQPMPRPTPTPRPDPSQTPRP